jgi:prepilin-type processing-associated H-X9-DG protein
MRHPRGLTLAEALVASLIIAILLFFLLSALGRERARARMLRCQENLHRIAKSMSTYVRDAERWFPCPLGQGRDPTTYNGAEWLATLYWTGYLHDPEVFLCPSSGDTNHGGADLGAERASAQFGSQTVSYAGMHWRSTTSTGSAILDMFLPSDAMDSDDTQGTINHGTGRRGGMNVLFFDSHSEFRPASDLDPTTAVGQKGGLLEKLRN